MATLGKYAIEPLETGFPKIRNKGLFGCACKHVLKVLKELTSNRLVFILCRELEKERKKPGFSSSRKGGVLSGADLRIAQAKRLTSDAAKAFRKYEKEAKELDKKAAPRKVAQPLLNEIKKILAMSAKNKMDPQSALAYVGMQYGMSLEDMKKIISDYGLEKGK